MEQLVINVVNEKHKSTFVIRKVQPENEAAHIHIYEMQRSIEGKTHAVNHVRFYGSEFEKRVWRQTGFNRVAVHQLMQRYFSSVKKAHVEASSHSG